MEDQKITPKTLALFTKNVMYKHNLKQLGFEDFNLAFDGHLRSNIHWVKLAKFIRCDELENEFSKKMTGSGLGPPTMSVRIALGALIIKEKRTFDEETVEQIPENSYLQYFTGSTIGLGASIIRL